MKQHPGNSELPNLWCLCLQSRLSRALKISEVGFQSVGVPHHTGERVAGSTSLPKPGASSAPEPQSYHIALWPLENTLQPHCKDAGLAHRAHDFHFWGREPCGGGRVFSTCVAKVPQWTGQNRNWARYCHRDKGNSPGMRKRFNLASINQEFLTKPYLFGKLLTNTNALEVSK